MSPTSRNGRGVELGRTAGTERIPGTRSGATTSGRTMGDPELRSQLRQRFGLDRTAGSARGTTTGRSAEISARRIDDVRRSFQLPGRGQVSRSGRSDIVTASRTGADTRGQRAGSLRGGADSVSRRLAGGDAEVARRVEARDRRAAGDPSLGTSGGARRIPPTGSGSPSGGGATVLPPVSHTPHSGSTPAPYYGSYYGSYYGYPGNCYPYYSYPYHCSSYPWFGFSIGFSFGYGYGYYGYPYYGCGSYWGWYGYPCYTVGYYSPYYYRYCYPYYYPYYYAYAPYYYGGSYYAFSADYGYVPYYESSYSTYERVVETPRPEAAPEPSAERALTAPELTFCEGWTLLRAGATKDAAQVLYTSTIDLAAEPLPNWFLAVALASSGDLELAQRTLGEVLRLDPSFLRHRWNPVAHLGADGDRVLRESLAAARTAEPLAAAPLALEAALSLLAGDSLRLEALRGVIAESLILDPEAPGLADALAEIRRRGDAAEGAAGGHPDAIAEAWLASPSCESIPSLGLSKE